MGGHGFKSYYLNIYVDIYIYLKERRGEEKEKEKEEKKKKIVWRKEGDEKIG